MAPIQPLELTRNLAASFNAKLERPKIGVFHRMSKDHMPRYVAEAVYRWNARGQMGQVTTKSGKVDTKRMRASFEDRVTVLLAGSLGTWLKWPLVGGIV